MMSRHKQTKQKSKKFLIAARRVILSIFSQRQSFHNWRDTKKPLWDFFWLLTAKSLKDSLKAKRQKNPITSFPARLAKCKNPGRAVSVTISRMRASIFDPLCDYVDVWESKKTKRRSVAASSPWPFRQWPDNENINTKSRFRFSVRMWDKLLMERSAEMTSTCCETFRLKSSLSLNFSLSAPLIFEQFISEKMVREEFELKRNERRE